MKFTSEDGREYELDEMLTVQNPKHCLVIREVKAEPKWHVTLGGSEYTEFTVHVILPPPTELDQAQLIKEACEWLMQTITDKGHYADHFDSKSSLDEAITRAHRALKENTK